MSEDQVKTVRADELPPETESQHLAMVYTGEMQELAGSAAFAEGITGAGINGVILVLVLSMMALVTISRRSSK